MPDLSKSAKNPKQAFAQATPRNAFLGMLSDALAQTYAPQRTQQMQGVANFLSVPAIADTLNRLSYGEPLTTGAGGVGGTTRLRPEALEATMALAPMAVPAGRAANAAAMAAGRAGERFAERAIPGAMYRGGITAEFLRAMGSNTVSPLDVYHGTPHKFDRFDASKIGTGEGAQAFGHGLYFAESPGVAKSYADNLTPPTVLFDNLPVNPDLYNDLLTKNFLNHLIRTKDPVRAAGATSFDTKAKWKDVLALQNRASVVKAEGNFYKVDLPDEAVSKMLDWDKPLSEQTEYVRKALEPLGYKSDKAEIDAFSDALLSALQGEGSASLPKMPRNPMGSQIARGQGIFDAPQDKVIAERLRQAGIPGIRYLDQDSRGTGAGTSNFVVFPGNENMLTILERNNQPVRQAMQDFERGLKNYIDSRSK